mgnify:FL=1
MPAHSRTIKGVSLILTCHGYPEQYNVYIGDKLLACFHLRHGLFRAIDSNFEEFFEYFTIRDEFDSEAERTYVLTRAVDVLLATHTTPIISMF